MPLYRLPGPDRRLLLTGLAATVACGRSSDALAQAPEEPASISLLTNLFTRVAASVTINDHGPFTFVIDTGAGRTSIADTLAGRLRLPVMEPVTVHGITTATRTDSVHVNRILLSGLGFRDVRCPILPADQLGADGLLGLDVLGRYRLGFNVDQRSATLSGRGARILMGGADMNTGTRLQRNGVRSVRGRFGQLLLTQTLVDGVETAAFIDSGAQYSVGNEALRRAITTRRANVPRMGRQILLYGVTGQSLPADIARVDDIRLGRSRLGPTPLLFADLHCFRTLELADRPALLVGADLLGRFRQVTLDFPGNTVAFEGLRRQTTRTIEDELRT